MALSTTAAQTCHNAQKELPVDPTCDSPSDELSTSFSSVATSLCTEASMTDCVTVSRTACDVFVEFSSSSSSSSSSDDDDDEERSTCSVGSAPYVDDGNEESDTEAEADSAERQRQARRERQLHAPSRVDLRHDRQSIMAERQNKLNNFILKEQRATIVSRDDHHCMLRQLIGMAYFRDPNRVAHRPQWKKIVAAVRKEYWGANAIFNLGPDPYQDVLAKLSSMMLWDNKLHHWTYAYHQDELERRQTRQMAILAELNKSGKLFL